MVAILVWRVTSVRHLSRPTVSKITVGMVNAAANRRVEWSKREEGEATSARTWWLRALLGDTRKKNATWTHKRPMRPTQHTQPRRIQPTSEHHPPPPTINQRERFNDIAHPADSTLPHPAQPHASDTRTLPPTPRPQYTPQHSKENSTSPTIHLLCYTSPHLHTPPTYLSLLPLYSDADDRMCLLMSLASATGMAFLSLSSAASQHCGLPVNVYLQY